MGSFEGYLRRVGARTRLRNLKAMAQWLGITVSKAQSLGGLYRPDVGLEKWRRDPKKKVEHVESRRQASITMRAKGRNRYARTREHRNKIREALKGRASTRTNDNIYRVRLSLGLLRRFNPDISRRELEARATSMLLRRGMKLDGAKGLVRMVMSDKQGGRPLKVDWAQVHVDRMSGKKVVAIASRLGISSEAVEKGYDRWVKAGGYLSR